MEIPLPPDTGTVDTTRANYSDEVDWPDMDMHWSIDLSADLAAGD